MPTFRIPYESLDPLTIGSADDDSKVYRDELEFELPEAQERSEQDEHAPLTCPTCGAGFDREGNLVHEPAIGP